MVDCNYLLSAICVALYICSTWPTVACIEFRYGCQAAYLFCTASVMLQTVSRMHDTLVLQHRNACIHAANNLAAPKFQGSRYLLLAAALSA